MCRQSMLLHAVLLVLLMGILPKAIQSQPESSDDDSVYGSLNTIQGENNETSQCVGFTNHYCNQFEDRREVYFPNLLGHNTVEEANRGFRDFIPLLQSGCHPKLGTLLCFIYFPTCASLYPSLRIYPCKEVCQEVHNSSCTALVNQYAGWNNQLQCDMSHYLPSSSGQCADGVAPHYPGAPTSAGMPTEVPSAEAPTKSVVCDDESCPSECNFRKNANSGTFRRNAYCYAARVTVKSYEEQGCHHAYTVEVKSQFDLQTPFNSSHSIRAPSMGESAVILTSPAHCTECPNLEANATYLIAGAYSKAADGSVQWKLEGVDDKSLVSDWVSKYDRKIDQFVSAGNSERKRDMKFLKECEGNNELVSEDQWIHH